MRNTLSIEPRIRNLVSYLEDIENGTLQIPSFQRDYVWGRDDIKELFDSIKNSYPIGSILLWRPEEEIGDEKEKIGSYYINKSSKEKIYILDGFQRLSTLFGCLTSKNRTLLNRDEKEWESLYNLYYDLEEEIFTYIRPKTTALPFQVPVHILLNSSDFRQFARREFEKLDDENTIDKYYDRADKLSRTLLEYQIASVDINNADISEAVEIFSRINSKGEPISFDWMANALSIKKGFRFGSEIDNLVEELKQYNFERIDRNAIFRCIQSSFGKLYIDNTKIEALAKRADFSSVTMNTLPKIKQAVKFMFEELLVLDSKLLPYPIQLIFITDFFKKKPEPTLFELNQLKEWFWVTSYSNYFTNYSLANQRRAYYHFQDFLDGKVDTPVYNDRIDLRFSTAEFPEKLNMGSVRAKALTLFMLNYSNSFLPVDSSNAVGFKIEKLFSNFMESDPNTMYIIDKYNSPENSIPYKYPNKIYEYTMPKIGKLYQLLEEYDDNFSHLFFVNDDMRAAYVQRNFSDVLSLRKRLIQHEESKFLTKFNLDYR